MKDFPKPNCEALTVPKLDQEFKEQLKRKGKDPFFGGEKSLYKIQEQLLDATGPLTCLWSDLLNKEAKVSSEDILHCKKVWVTSTTFWSLQLHSFCVHDTYSSRNALQFKSECS